MALGATHALAQSYVLDDFESGSIRIVQPNTSGPNKYLWNLYNGVGSGNTSITTAESYSGSHSLRSTLTSGNWQFQFYSYTEGQSGFSNDWQFMRRFVTNPSSYQTGKVNRMRFWIKLPPGLSASGGDHNFELGTYVRCSSCSGAETGGGHFYHFYNFASTGEWEQVIVDTHPDHERGASGNSELPDQLHPSGEQNYTYFDLMTRFYLDFPYEDFRYPADFYMDGFELYVEPNPENVDQVRSLHAVYVPDTNEIRVGWTRKKNEDNVRHEVRYSFSDIHANGWNSATSAPNGVVSPPSSGGYNGMIYRTTGIDVSGRSQVYIAIKPQNSNLFRQIVVPVGEGASISPPKAPTALQVQ